VTRSGFVNILNGGAALFRDVKWSSSEKKIARSAFDTALESALAKVMAEFKRKANAASTPSEMSVSNGRRSMNCSIIGTRNFLLSWPGSFEKRILMKASSQVCQKRS
jgi:hypothetical protein